MTINPNSLSSNSSSPSLPHSNSSPTNSPVLRTDQPEDTALDHLTQLLQSRLSSSREVTSSNTVEEGPSMSSEVPPRTPSSKTEKIRERISSHYSGSSLDLPEDLIPSPHAHYSPAPLPLTLPQSASQYLNRPSPEKIPNPFRSSDPLETEDEKGKALAPFELSQLPYPPEFETALDKSFGSSDPVPVQTTNPAFAGSSDPVQALVVGLRQSSSPSSPSPDSFHSPSRHPPSPDTVISDMGDHIMRGGNEAGPAPRAREIHDDDVIMATEGVPDLNPCGDFDGKESAVRWLARVHWQFRRAGYTEAQIPTVEAISSINMLCTGEAATFLDSTPKLQEIIERSAENTATVKDLRDLEQALKDRYPNKPIDSGALEDDLTRIAQKPDEPLAQYHSRVQNALRQAGGRDVSQRSRDGQAELSGAEATLLRTVVSGFVDGLRDFKLRQEAVSQRARNAKSLWKCHEIIRDSQLVLEDREKAEKEEATRAEVQAIQKALSENKGLTVRDAVRQLHPQVTTHYTAQVPPNAVQYNTQHPPQNGAYQNPPAAHAEYQQPYRQYPQRPREYAPYDNGNAYGTSYYQRATSLPSKLTSKHPLVNGTEVLAQGEKACFRCGSRKYI